MLVIMWTFPNRLTPRKLSDRDTQWATKMNGRGDTPEIDFACSTPFNAIDETGISELLDLIGQHRDRIYRNARSVTLRGIEPLQRLLATAELEDLASRTVGVPIQAHPMKLEHAHINLQDPDRDVVDDWHFDYVPFVFVLRLAGTDHKSGRLQTDGFGDHSLAPGQGLLLQGSHVRHRAESARTGDRITAVVSLAPASFDHLDTTFVHRGKLPFSPDEPLYDQFGDYRRSNIAEIEARLANLQNDSSRPLLERRLEDERRRLAASTANDQDL